MSEHVIEPQSEPEELKLSNDENPEKTAASQRSTSDDVQIPESTRKSKTTCEDPEERASTPKSVRSNETTDRDGSTPSGWDSDEFFSASEWQEPRKKPGKKKSGLSARMEYLARPKKDFLDRVGFERFDGVLPEKSLPSWPILPLPTKLPAASYPCEITMTKLGENVYLPPPGVKMDLRDENNLRPPIKIYHSLHDPHLKPHFRKEKIRKHLKRNGYVSEAGRVVCSLENINEYREYTRRILAERIQQMYRDQQEEQKKEQERRMKLKNDEEEEKLGNARAQTNLRSYIKNAVSSIQEGSMELQRERDRKTLNKQIRLQTKWKQSARAKQERYEQNFHQHMSNKYEREEKRRLMELEMARRDVEHIEELCRKREKERLDRQQKLEDFWLRKAEEQIEWVEKGLELETKWFEDREAKIAWRRTQAVAPHIKRKAPKVKKSEEIDHRTLDEILKEDEDALTLDETLREEATGAPKDEYIEEEKAEDLKDKFVTADPESFIDDGFKKSSSERFIIPNEPDQKNVTEETQPEPNISIKKDEPLKPKNSDNLKQIEESDRAEQDKIHVLQESEQDRNHVIRNTEDLHKGKDLSAKSLSFDKGKPERRPSYGRSILKMLRSKGAGSKQKASRDKSSSEQKLKEESIEAEQQSKDVEDIENKGVMAEPETFIRSSEQKPKEESTEEEQHSQEAEDLENKGVMAEPETFIRSETKKSKSDTMKQKDKNSDNKDPK